MERMGDPLDTYKSGNGDLKVPNVGSVTGIRPEMNISALSLKAGGGRHVTRRPDLSTVNSARL